MIHGVEASPLDKTEGRGELGGRGGSERRRRVRSGARGRESRGGERHGKEVEGIPGGMRGNVRGVQAVEEAGEQGGGGARVRRAQLLLCLLARGRRRGCPWWAGPPGVLASWAVTAPGQVSGSGTLLSFLSVFYFCSLFLIQF